MSAESTIYSKLSGDATLLTTATGGVWTFDQTKQKGLNRTLTPSVFDATGVIKPAVLISARSPNPGYNIQDDTGQVMDVREVVEIYCYADAAYSVIETMENRIYALLHTKWLGGMYRVDWAGTLRMSRDVDLDAYVRRSDYLCVWVRSV